MTLLRRYLVVQILMLWQGGFLFYASFVVPTGTQVLGSSEAQGSITARVTDSLNLCGVAGLAILAWELWAGRDIRRRKLFGWGCWIAAAGCQAALFALHIYLESLMNPERTFVIDRGRFYRIHGAYLWTSTAMWAACLALTWSLLRGWTDRAN
ncbi:MAG TPA: hypothetical protein VN641_22970 [Urbifossiella sp.]|nr:hypothetical protein [Urbifossiella sp.]